MLMFVALLGKRKFTETREPKQHTQNEFSLEEAGNRTGVYAV
jgi:hypothetical protein